MITDEANIVDIQAEIEGPVGTPYEGGVFRCKLAVENDFPNNPPKGTPLPHSGFFITKIFHPNVSEKGEICVNTLKKDWNPTAWSLYNILEVVKCLLIVPFPESSLNEQAGKLIMENYEEYFKHAKLITSLYATPKELKTLENVHCHPCRTP
jgi:ubiquitin-conjugating enzyme E2 S